MYDLKLDEFQVLKIDFLTENQFLSLPFEMQKKWFDKYKVEPNVIESIAANKIEMKEFKFLLSESVIIGQLNKKLDKFQPFFDAYMKKESEPNDIPNYEEFALWERSEEANEQWLQEFHELEVHEGYKSLNLS